MAFCVGHTQSRQSTSRVRCDCRRQGLVVALKRGDSVVAAVRELTVRIPGLMQRRRERRCQAELRDHRETRGVVDPGIGILLAIAAVFSSTATAAACALPEIRIVEPVSPVRWLPDGQLPARRDGEDRFDVAGARGQMLSLSLLVRSDRPAQLTATGVLDFGNSGLVRMDARYVKAWVQGATAWRWINHKPGYSLVPELLLHDDSLVEAEPASGDNRIRIRKNDRSSFLMGRELEGIGLDGDPRRKMVTRYQYELDDSAEVQPLFLQGNTLRQIWLQFRVPSAVAGGVFSGTVTVACEGFGKVEIPVVLRVHSFDLAAPALRYGVFYRGVLWDGEPGITSEQKVTDQMRVDLQAIHDLGIQYPTLYQSMDDEGLLRRALELRKQIGFPVDEVYYLGGGIADKFLKADLRAVDRIAKRAEKLFEEFGYGRVVFYAVDEGDASTIRRQLPGWRHVRSLGQGVMVSGRVNNLEAYPGAADIYVAAYAPDPAFARLVHEKSGRVFSYANPQGGVENPYLFRLNYGVDLWRARYDGALIYAYQDMRGIAWSDFDGQYRDHFLVYPTTHGMVPTLAWEGLREAIYDVRYLTTLERMIDAGIRAEQCTALDAAIDRGGSILEGVRDGQYRDPGRIRGLVSMAIEDVMQAHARCLAGSLQ